MKVLVFTTQDEDYLADVALYGLRKRFQEDVIDVPHKDIMYKSSQRKKHEIYGNGFTIWKLLDEIDVKRDELHYRISSREFDVIVFSSIWRQLDKFHWLKQSGLSGKAELRFLDGEDEGSSVCTDAAAAGPYFKRETTHNFAGSIKPISFAIPDIKRQLVVPPKTRLFASHVQCEEAYHNQWIATNCHRHAPFTEEEAYRENIAQSRYAVTMKKGGWDCMRHYEQAANCAVLCFYQLGSKPLDSAPYGLVDGKNCISFSSAADLDNKLKIYDDRYQDILSASMTWIASRTCERLADYIISAGESGSFGPQH